MESVIGPEQLEALLLQLRQSDSEQIRQAEAVLKKALAQPFFMCDLLGRLHGSAAPEARQLAAVLMRRRLGGHWRKYAPALQAQIKSALLERVGAEPVSLVRSSTADLVCVVAKQALPKGEWPELLAFIAQCARAEQEAHREVAMQLVGSLLDAEEVIAFLQPHFEALKTMLSAALSEPPPSTVPRAALKALSAWAQALVLADESETQESFAVLRPLLPLVMQVGAVAVAAGDDETVRLGCNMLDEIVESCPALAKAQLHPMLDFALQSAEAQSLAVESRASALQLAQTLVTAKAKQIAKEQLVSSLVLRLFELACEADDGDDDDDNEASMHLLASQACLKRGLSPSASDPACARLVRKQSVACV